MRKLIFIIFSLLLLVALLISTTGRSKYNEKTDTSEFEIIAPPELQVSHILLLLPVAIGSEPERPYMSAVLIFHTNKLPWKMTLERDSVVCRLKDGSLVEGSYFAFSGGWSVGMTPPGSRRFMPVKLSTPFYMNLDEQKVPITPTWAVSLAGSVSAEFKESGCFAWFLFSIDDLEFISEMTIGDIKLKRKETKKLFDIKEFAQYVKQTEPCNVAIHEDYKITKAPGEAFVVLPFDANGKALLWGHGSQHTLIGNVEIKEYIFESDKEDPLQFKLDKNAGYVYMKGKGTVTYPDGKTVKLPQ